MYSTANLNRIPGGTALISELGESGGAIMRFLKFEIENFKGIENAVLDLTKLRAANVITLIGLNEMVLLLFAFHAFSGGPLR